MFRLAPLARLAYVTLLAIAAVCSPTRTRADAAATAFEIDFAAARGSALGDEVTLAYAALLGMLEGSFADPDAPAITIDRASCAFTPPGESACRLRGRFAPAAFATVRSRDPNATAQTASVGMPDLEGVRASLRACSETLWVIGTSPPPPSACAEGTLAVDDPVYAQFAARRHVAIWANVAALGLPLPGIAVMRIGITFAETVEGRYELSFEDVTAAAAFRNALDARADLGPLTQYGFRVDRSSVHGSGTELSMRIVGEASALRDLIVNLFFAMEAQDDEAQMADSPRRTLEPMAEIEAFRERVASDIAPATAHLSMGADTAMPIVMLSSEDYEVDDVIFDAVIAPISGMRPRVFYVPGNGRTPTWLRPWTHHAEALLADVRGRVQAAAMNVDPCAQGCVLVAAGASTELAIELAALDPARFPHVVLREIYRADALPFLAEVRTLPSGVSFTLFGREDDEVAEPGDGIEALRLAFARKRLPRGTTIVRGELAGFGHATRVALGTRPNVRAGVLDTTTPRRQTVDEARARACRRGDAAACYAAYAEARGDGPLPEDMPTHTVLALDRGCALGYGPACYETSGRYEEDELPFVASLAHACELGSADACATLGYGFGVGRGVPADDHTALALYVRGCELGAPRGCENAVLALRHPETRLRLDDVAIADATRALRPRITDPAMRARMRALCDDARDCVEDENVEAWLAETEPTTGGAP